MCGHPLNLRTLKPTPDTRTDDQRRQLAHLLDTVYNGWTREPAKWTAGPAMASLADSGMTWATFVGSVLATHPHSCDIQKMAKVAPEVWRHEIAERQACLARPF